MAHELGQADETCLLSAKLRLNTRTAAIQAERNNSWQVINQAICHEAKMPHQLPKTNTAQVKALLTPPDAAQIRQYYEKVR